MHQLTKTNFMQYLNCPKSLWLLKNKPEDYPDGEFSLFLEKLVKDGYEVEEYAKKLFPGGVDLPEFASTKRTQDALGSEGKYFFQASFETEDKVFARTDILQKNEDGSLSLFEVKSSTKITNDKAHMHITDVCFQKYVLEKIGYTIRDISIVHTNGKYVRSGEIEPEKLLIIESVIDKVEELYPEVTQKIEAAIELINQDSIDLGSCGCTQKTKSNHCDSYEYFNGPVSKSSIYYIGNIKGRKFDNLVHSGIAEIKDIPDDNELNEKQNLQILSTKRKEPVINHKDIQERLDALVFPLHFIDYETFATAVPVIDGTSPHQQLVFQVSIHSVFKDGTHEHFEYLADKPELPQGLVEGMYGFTGASGTFVSWHASFERDRNIEMAEMFPQFKDYLEYQNETMFDLKKVFSDGLYVDYKFNGSNSIKDVLPVIAPELSHKELEVSNGTMAADLWGRMVLETDFAEDKEKARDSLLKYCELDTWAMVEIFKFLTHLT